VRLRPGHYRQRRVPRLRGRWRDGARRAGDAPALAAAAERLLRDDAERARLAEAGADLVRRRFHWDTTAALLEPRLEAYVAGPARYQQPPVDALAGEGAG
jgi:hypothetical protein